MSTAKNTIMTGANTAYTCIYSAPMAVTSASAPIRDTIGPARKKPPSPMTQDSATISPVQKLKIRLAALSFFSPRRIDI